MFQATIRAAVPNFSPRTPQARTHHEIFKQLYAELNQEDMEHDYEVMAQSQGLQEALAKAGNAS